MNKLKQWFIANRGYSLPMSLLCFLTAFTFGYIEKGNFLYGLIALIAIVLLHLGVNLYDDYIDVILKTPKQKCKTEYIDKNIFTLKHILIGFVIYFLVALVIGIFFIFKCGLELFYIVIPSTVIALFYPKSSRYLPSEFLIMLMFGGLMFEGIYFVMKQSFSLDLLLISIPVGILVGVVAMVHSFMDLDFDKMTGKKTYPSLFKTKEQAINGIITIIIVAYIFTLFLVFKGIVSYLAIFSFASIYFVFKLKEEMTKYIKAPENEAFLPNFMLSQKIFIFYTVVMILSIITK